MSPEERQLLTGLLDRIKGSANAPRDPEAEALIANAVRAMPYAPYLLAQAVLVQDQALRAANDKLSDLQAQLDSLQPPPPPQSGGFLSGLSSIFGGAPSQQPPEPPRGPSPGPWGQGPQAPPQSYPPQQPYPPQQGGGWGAPPPPSGGGFLSGALQSAAGVAGGVLLADSIRNLFGGHAGGGLGGLGIGSGLGTSGLGTSGLGAGGLGNTGLGGGETIVNNYYDDNGRDGDLGRDTRDFGRDDDVRDTSYDGSDSADFNGDDGGSFDV